MDILKKIGQLSDNGSPFVLATIVGSSGSSPAKPGFRMIVESGGRLSGTIGGGALEKLIADEAGEILSGKKLMKGPERRSIDLSGLEMSCGGRVELLLEYFSGGRGFVLFGGGHLGRALAPILELLDYKVTVYDNRPEIRELIETEFRKVIIADFEYIPDLSSALSGSGGCFIATHGHEWDSCVLKQVITEASALPYIGMIGSKSKVGVALDRLRAEGLTIPANLYSPVGLRIGGNTAAEIAVGIAAEIIAVNNEKEISHMRLEGISGDSR